MADADAVAQERRTRLKALRTKRDTSEKMKSASSKDHPVIKFRNYQPHTEELKEKKLPRVKPESVESQVSDQLEAAKEPSLGDVNLTNLAPKKADWDLKRDISKKLEKLERRTQKAIVELIRERLMEDTADLASTVAAHQQEDDEPD